MIFDCFLYNGEWECLEIRLNELLHLDLIHILVQGNKTFTNKPKEFYNVDHGRILDVRVTDMPDGDDPWKREKWLRNCILRGLEEFGAHNDDLVIIADADEIPNANAIRKYDPSMKFTALVMDKFGYWLNCVEGRQRWKIAKIMTYEMLKWWTPDHVRNSGQESFIENAGWHFSYLGDAERNKKKLESFSHTECNTEELRSKLEGKIKTGQSLWSDCDYWEIVKIDSSFPQYVQDHQFDTLKHLIKEI